MYISKVELKNIACFEHINLNFKINNDILNWAVILGDNGTGKTSLLRCIAMGLCEQTSAAGLLEELWGDLLRSNRKEALINIDLISSTDPNKAINIKTILTKSNGTVKLEKKIDNKAFNWKDIFVTGYGAARGVFGSEDYREYTAVDAVYSLFNYKSLLQSPELAIRRILAEQKTINIEKKEKKILNWIDRILMLDEGSTKLDKSGFSISGPWGKFMPLGALGDGYRATLAWICDLLGWALLYDDKMFQKDLSGIVLIDEIEHHLHPKWQKFIIKLLRDQFPKIQFIISTHSPMCAVGTTELDDHEVKIVLLTQSEGYVEASEHAPPRGKRADQVLTSYLFGLLSASDNVVKEEIAQLSAILSKKDKSLEDEGKLQQLRQSLSKKLGSGETELESFVARGIAEVFDNEINRLSFDKEAINFEVKRQLKELLED